jgi:hypothetical protein
MPNSIATRRRSAAELMGWLRFPRRSIIHHRPIWAAVTGPPGVSLAATAAIGTIARRVAVRPPIAANVD